MVNQTKGIEVIKKFKYVTKTKSTWDTLKALYFGWNKRKLIEWAEDNLRALRPFETVEGESERVFFKILQEIDGMKILKEIKDFSGYINESFSKVGIEK